MGFAVVSDAAQMAGDILHVFGLEQVDGRLALIEYAVLKDVLDEREVGFAIVIGNDPLLPVVGGFQGNRRVGDGFALVQHPYARLLPALGAIAFALAVVEANDLQRRPPVVEPSAIGHIAWHRVGRIAMAHEIVEGIPVQQAAGFDAVSVVSDQAVVAARFGWYFELIASSCFLQINRDDLIVGQLEPELGELQIGIRRAAFRQWEVPGLDQRLQRVPLAPVGARLLLLFAARLCRRLRLLASRGQPLRLSVVRNQLLRPPGMCGQLRHLAFATGRARAARLPAVLRLRWRALSRAVRTGGLLPPRPVAVTRNRFDPNEVCRGEGLVDQTSAHRCQAGDRDGQTFQRNPQHVGLSTV
ncbi:MAG: hypothetical protein C0606_06255 [Hyphomicrobiales bacterium]|nr:MAG: hypothetical protein C0606_06255 [Hyphomicrobiales bacterium]